MAHGCKNGPHLFWWDPWDRLTLLKGLLVLTAAVNINQYGAQALTQSHQGSANTNEFRLTEASPNARIQISTSSSVYVVHLVAHSTESLEEPEWKVSLELLAMQLCEPANVYSGDKLKVVYSDPTSIRSTTWKANVSYSSVDSIDIIGTDDNNEKLELTDIQADQIVLIPEGRWSMSAADLIATMYQDPFPDGSCPEDSFPCVCAVEDSEEENSLDDTSPSPHNNHHLQVVDVTRCIPMSLICNGHPNCGFGCGDDESEATCSGNSSSSAFSPTITSCIPPEKLSTTTVNPPLESTDSGVGETASIITDLVLVVNIGVMIFMNKFLLNG